jgi:putative transposase
VKPNIRIAPSQPTTVDIHVIHLPRGVKTPLSEEQIIGILKEQEAGAKTQDLCRRHGISGTTFFKWKAKFGGLEASDAKRLRSLEDENRRLKKLLAEQLLDNAALKDLVGKNF